MNTLKLLAMLAGIMLLSGASCNKETVSIDKDDNPRVPLELSTKSAEFAKAGDGFSFEFIERVNSSTDDDYVVSPLSMQFLLGMVLDGAKGETADQICAVLGYGKGETAAVNEYCLSMLTQLPLLDKKTTLSLADAIFVDNGWPLKDSYIADVVKYYDAAVSNLDFHDNDASLAAINGWCDKHTNGLIPKVLDKVDPDMLAYLLNALYFKSSWMFDFQKTMTREEVFTSESGAKGKAKMMKHEATHPYAANEIYQALTLPYGNGAFAMTVLLPMPGHKVADVIASLKVNGLPKMHSTLADVWLPKFETKFSIRLNDILSDMGMPMAFDGKSADFTGMSLYALCLSFVQQDAIIKVDEEGTEAAAISSAGIAKNTSVGSDPVPIVFHADHPFLYLITETTTGITLFAGRYSGK